MQARGGYQSHTGGPRVSVSKSRCRLVLAANRGTRNGVALRIEHFYDGIEWRPKSVRRNQYVQTLTAFCVKAKIILVGFSGGVRVGIDMAVDRHRHGNRLCARWCVVGLPLIRFRLVSNGEHHFVERPFPTVLYFER